LSDRQRLSNGAMVLLLPVPKRKAKALRLEHIAQMVNHLRQLPDTKKKQRDIALVLTGFFGAFRRSELVAIQIGDLVWEPEGLLIRLSRSKTDQQAMGLVRALPFGAPGCCPAMAMKNWIELADINEGPVFRPVNRWDKVQPKALNPGGINQLLKTLGNACQFDFVPDLSSHSFRRGLSTSAAREKIDFEFIKKQGGWKSDATVWEYIEEGQQFTNNASFILLEKLQALIDSQLQ
jgi:integrase